MYIYRIHIDCYYRVIVTIWGSRPARRWSCPFLGQRRPQPAARSGHSGRASARSAPGVQVVLRAGGSG